MGTRTATNSLVKRTAFSSAINIFPNEVAPSTTEVSAEHEIQKKSHVRPYSEVPGPKGLPIIGNSWRFAPLIGKIYSNIVLITQGNQIASKKSESKIYKKNCP